MIRMIILAIFSFGSFHVHAQSEDGKKKVKVKYRKNEKFDLDELSIEGDGSSPGDLSITNRYRSQFRNKLPHRHNFNPELRNAVESIR